MYVEGWRRRGQHMLTTDKGEWKRTECDNGRKMLIVQWLVKVKKLVNIYLLICWKSYVFQKGLQAKQSPIIKPQNTMQVVRNRTIYFLNITAGWCSGLMSRLRNQRSRFQIPVVSRGFCDEILLHLLRVSSHRDSTRHYAARRFHIERLRIYFIYYTKRYKFHCENSDTLRCAVLHLETSRGAARHIATQRW
jgi:hypothetical protein